MRLAFFGGTFDPIHRGHLAVATAAAAHLALDTVLFAPTGRQPLKPARSTAPFHHRLAMTALGCAAASSPPEHGNGARLLASDLDAPRPDGSPNYTVDVLDQLNAQISGTPLFSIVGLDSFLTLPRWRHPDRLIELAEWIVVSRPGYRFDRSALATFTTEQQGRIHLLHSVHEDVSATELRHRLLEGDPCVDLIPDLVAAYIVQHKLYRKPA